MKITCDVGLAVIKFSLAKKQICPVAFATYSAPGFGKEKYTVGSAFVVCVGTKFT